MKILISGIILLGSYTFVSAENLSNSQMIEDDGCYTRIIRSFDHNGNKMGEISETFCK